jgi:hypothetical protein
MPTILLHRRIRIVSLDQNEHISEHCKPGDIALVEDGTGWWTHFVEEGGQTTTYDEPYKTYNEALWAAKAAAEFSAEAGS